MCLKGECHDQQSGHVLDVYVPCARCACVCQPVACPTGLTRATGWTRPTGWTRATGLTRASAGGKAPLAVPCTPAGCIELLQRSGTVVKGKEVVVVGRSNIVGMPVAHLLTSMDATVTVCHSRTADLAGHVKRADIVVGMCSRASAPSLHPHPSRRVRPHPIAQRPSPPTPAAVGAAEMIKGEWIKPGATVIDVGVNSKPAPEDPRGMHVCMYACTR